MSSRETVCVLHRFSGHWQVSGMWFSSWLQASGLLFRRMLELETSEVVPALNLCSACLPCCRVPFCVWVNCGSGGIPAPPETCLLCFLFFFFNPCITLPFVRLILTATPTHGPVVTISQLLSSLCPSGLSVWSALFLCEFIFVAHWGSCSLCTALYLCICLFFAVHCCMHRFVSAPLSACLVAVTIKNILFLHGPSETGGVVLWSVKPYTAAECCKDLVCS